MEDEESNKSKRKVQLPEPFPVSAQSQGSTSGLPSPVSSPQLSLRSSASFTNLSKIDISSGIQKKNNNNQRIERPRHRSELPDVAQHPLRAVQTSSPRISVGICAMDKKANSKPMKEILSQFGPNFEIVYYGNKMLLDDPIEDWPRVDCLIAFYSTGFPLEKAIAYVEQTKPHLVNDLQMQRVLFDRREVYALLDAIGVPTPRRVTVDRAAAAAAAADDAPARPPPAIEEHDEFCVFDGQKLYKPFVEKPVDADDHNIHIYYPLRLGGGSKRLFRKVGDRSSEFYPEENAVRREGSYIYEEYVLTQGTDVKVYTVGPDYGHAEARKSPTLDGKVKRDKNGKEERIPVLLSREEKMMAAKISLAFKQWVCGFDILRTKKGSVVCDVNGWSFVKGNKKYYADCAQLLQEQMAAACFPSRYLASASAVGPMLRQYTPCRVPLPPSAAAAAAAAAAAGGTALAAAAGGEGAGPGLQPRRLRVAGLSLDRGLGSLAGGQLLPASPGKEEWSPDSTLRGGAGALAAPAEGGEGGGGAPLLQQQQPRPWPAAGGAGGGGPGERDDSGWDEACQHPERTKTDFESWRFDDEMLNYADETASQVPSEKSSMATPGPYDDRKHLGKLEEENEHAPHSAAPSQPADDAEEPASQASGSTGPGGDDELRCVIAVARHGDRTPKQKLKMETSHAVYLDLFHEWAEDPRAELKIKKKDKMAVFFEATGRLIRELESSTDPGQEEDLENLRNIKDVLGRWKFSGINRKIQLKPKQWEKLPPAPRAPGSAASEGEDGAAEAEAPSPVGRGGLAAAPAPSEDGGGAAAASPSSAAPTPLPAAPAAAAAEGEAAPGGDAAAAASEPPSARGSPAAAAGPPAVRATRLQMVVKWGGDLTDLGKDQAERVGREFRTFMYPDPGGGGGGLLRLHATFRHDLKIRTSNEGRVMKTAAAFTKGLLELDGDLTPILASLVLKEYKSELMLDRSGNQEVKGEMDRCKRILNEELQLDVDVSEKGALASAAPAAAGRGQAAAGGGGGGGGGPKGEAGGGPGGGGGGGGGGPPAAAADKDRAWATPSTRAALRRLGNPRAALVRLHAMVQGLAEQCVALRDRAFREGDEVELYEGETLGLLAERWSKLAAELYSAKKGRFDLSKVPDVLDNVRYDGLHNAHLGLAGLEELYRLARTFAAAVVPQEFGLNPEDKRLIGAKTCRQLLDKIHNDISIARTDDGADLHFKFDASHAEEHNINSIGRRVRTRLYFTSESHLHTLINCLRYPPSEEEVGGGGGGGGGEDEDRFAPLLGRAARRLLGRIPELSYLTMVVFRLFEDPRRAGGDPERFRVEILFTPGVTAHPDFRRRPPGPGAGEGHSPDALAVARAYVLQGSLRADRVERYLGAFARRPARGPAHGCDHFLPEVARCGSVGAALAAYGAPPPPPQEEEGAAAAGGVAAPAEEGARGKGAGEGEGAGEGAEGKGAISPPSSPPSPEEGDAWGEEEERPGGLGGREGSAQSLVEIPSSRLARRKKSPQTNANNKEGARSLLDQQLTTIFHDDVMKANNCPTDTSSRLAKLMKKVGGLGLAIAGVSSVALISYAVIKKKMMR